MVGGKGSGRVDGGGGRQRKDNSEDVDRGGKQRYLAFILQLRGGNSWFEQKRIIINTVYEMSRESNVNRVGSVGSACPHCAPSSVLPTAQHTGAVGVCRPVWRKKLRPPEG